MTSLDRYSPASSAASSTDSSLPRSRIRCKKDQIAVGERKFESATDALFAYLQQYDASPGGDGISNGNIGPSTDDVLQLGGDAGSLRASSTMSAGSKLTQASGKGLAGSGLVRVANGIKFDGAKDDVENLLTSQVSPQLQEEVTDTLREVKLRRLLKQAAMKSQKQTKTGLQQEVEAALIRSAQLLEKVTKEDVPSKKAVVADSDISDIPTEILLNDTSLSLDMSDLEEKPTGHIYSYRKSRPQKSSLHNSLSQSLCAPVSYPTHGGARTRRRHASIDSLLPPSLYLPPSGKRSPSSSSASLSNQSDPTDILQRVRSRSVSPGLRARGDAGGPEWVAQLDQSVRKSVPSWVGEISPSEVSDSLWTSDDLLEDKHNRRPYKVPSWVAEVENVDGVEDLKYVNATPTRRGRDRNKRGVSPAGHAQDNTCDITTDSRPGLNFSDLATSALHTPGSSKHVTFTDSRTKQRSLSAGRQLPKHSSPLPRSRSCKVSDTDPSLARPQPSRVLDSEFNGEAFLRNNILPQTARLKKSIDNYVTSTENLRRKSVSSNSSDTSSDHRCSSLDTLALLTGKPLTRRDNTDVFSPIPKDSSMVPKSYSTSPAISAVNSDGQAGTPVSNGHDQDSSDGLDGDRSWEKVTSSFKPPVHVDSADMNGHSPQKRLEGTLSGGKQPGSMETLKNMLFKLQAEETSTQGGNTKNEESLESSHSNSQSSMAIIPALKDYDFQQEPGGHSLEKALVHLNRLKKLVMTTGTPATGGGALKTTLTSDISHNGVHSDGS